MSSRYERTRKRYNLFIAWSKGIKVKFRHNIRKFIGLGIRKTEGYKFHEIEGKKRKEGKREFF